MARIGGYGGATGRDLDALGELVGVCKDETLGLTVDEKRKYYLGKFKETEENTCKTEETELECKTEESETDNFSVPHTIGDVEYFLENVARHLESYVKGGNEFLITNKGKIVLTGELKPI